MDGQLQKEDMLKCGMSFVSAISTSPTVYFVSPSDMLYLMQCVRGRQNCLREADLMGSENFASTKLFTGGGRRVLFQPSIDLRFCKMFANRKWYLAGTVCRNSLDFYVAVAIYMSQGSAPVCWQTLHILQVEMMLFPYPYTCHIFLLLISGFSAVL